MSAWSPPFDGISVTSFDGHCVRLDFETREEAEDFAEKLMTPPSPHYFWLGIDAEQYHGD